jgi:hypothetical protein
VDPEGDFLGGYPKGVGGRDEELHPGKKILWKKAG